MSRYLIIKTSAFGDVVQSFPVVHYIKERDPDASIDWVVEQSILPLVQAHPLVDRTIELNAKNWKKRLFCMQTIREAKTFVTKLREYAYDAVFDLQGNCKSGLISFLAKSNQKIGFGMKAAPERANCFFSNRRFDPPKGQNIRRDYLFLVQSYFKDFSKPCCEKVLLNLSQQEAQELSTYEKSIPPNAWMICPFSQWSNKEISSESLEQFLRAAEREFQPFFVFVWSNDREKEVVEKLAQTVPRSLVCKALSIPTLQHLMNKMQLVVAMDSFPLHLAGTTQVATCSIFGPSLSAKFRPLGSQHFSYQGSCPYQQRFEKRCPILRTCSTGACLKDVSIPDLFILFSRWWNNRPVI